MEIYLAGNFPQMSEPVREKAMAKFVVGIEKKPYNRLVSFYYQKEADNAIFALKNYKKKEVGNDE